MNKQSFNGKQGEDRTRALLGKRFFVLERSVDVEGADFLVQTQHDTIEQLRQEKDKISILGIIQSKYFENNNEVLIHRHYVEDKDGVISEFFAILHTDVLEEEHTYFFDAQDILDSWVITERNSGKTPSSYYRFKITKKRKYSRYLNLPKSEILQKIEDGIIKSEQYRNNSYINKILEKESSPISVYNKGLSPELLKRIENKHIVDKMYYSLKDLDKFRRIFPYRIANNLSFESNHKSSSFYHNFKLRTNNTEILELFEKLEISDSVKITMPDFLKTFLTTRTS
jgi:hypothetical protein